MNDKKIPFTAAMRDHLVKQEAYYGPLSEAVVASGTRFFAGIQDIQMTERSLGNGEVQVQVSFPIDDNKNPSDGRIQLTDSFVLSSDGRRVKSFDRKFHYNQKGASALWQNRLSGFRHAGLPTGALQQQFADQVLTKSLLIGRIKDSPEAMQFMEDSGDALQQGLQDNQMQFFPKDFRSYATVEKSGDGYKVKCSWVVDNDQDGKNGRWIMEDQFLLDSNKKFKSHQRAWANHPDSQGNGPASLVQFYSVSKPSKKTAKAFIEALLPAFFSAERTSDPKLGELQQVHVPPGEVPGSRVELGDVLVQGPAPLASTVSAPAVKKSGGGSTFEFSFNQSPTLERNTNSNNAPGHLTRSAAAYLRGQLGKRGMAGVVQFNFDIHFHQETGYVTKVVATVLKDSGLGLGGAGLRDLLQGTARRIQMSLRAEPSLAGNTMRSPLTVIIKD